MKKHVLIIFLVFIGVHTFAQKKKTNYKDQWQFSAKDSSMYVTVEQQKELYASESEMQWFKNAKLGIFVHWGPALLKTNPNPTDADIDVLMNGNICRCGTYNRIKSAIKSAASKM